MLGAFSHRRRRWLAGLIAALVVGVGLRELVGANPPAVRPPPLPPVGAPPRPPAPPTPVDRFRELLARDAAGREQVLTNRNPEQAQYLRARLAEYDALPRAERESRLQLLTLRHYLIPLLSQAPTNRAESLSLIPRDFRAIVKDRLEAWDALPAEQQRELLASGSLFTGMPLVVPGNAAEQRTAIAQQPAASRSRLEADFARWQGLSEETRQRVTTRFQTLLALSEGEREKTLTRLDDASRARAERVLKNFGGRPREEHAQLVQALNRFNALPPADRERFLKNAARWEAMSQHEKQAWRRVTQMLPPSPPGLNDPVSLPPQPPEVPASPFSATNGQASR